MSYGGGYYGSTYYGGFVVEVSTEVAHPGVLPTEAASSPAGSASTTIIATAVTTKQTAGAVSTTVVATTVSSRPEATVATRSSAGDVATTVILTSVTTFGH